MLYKMGKSISLQLQRRQKYSQSDADAVSWNCKGQWTYREWGLLLTNKTASYAAWLLML